MTRAVLWSHDALAALKKIARYVAAKNPVAVPQLIHSIRDAGTKLGERPIGHSGCVSGTYEKSLPDLPYIMVYALNPDDNGHERVIILRVIHSA